MSDGAEVYDGDYFLRGKQSGKSLYENYRWLPDLTIPMAQRIVDHLGIQRGESVLDFGCARGYTVRALRGLGYDAWGFDVSRWAIEHADEQARPYLWHVEGQGPSIGTFDWVIAKDVLEHIPYVQMVVESVLMDARRGCLVVVPLSEFRNARYVIENYEKDITHCQRLNLLQWLEMFLRPGWSVEASYRLPGVKDNYYRPGMERGNGFITARRIEEVA